MKQTKALTDTDLQAISSLMEAKLDERFEQFEEKYLKHHDKLITKITTESLLAN